MSELNKFLNTIGLEEEVSTHDKVPRETRYVALYEKSSNAQLVHNDSQMLNAAIKKALRRLHKANQWLTYYTLHLTVVLWR